MTDVDRREGIQAEREKESNQRNCDEKQKTIERRVKQTTTKLGQNFMRQ